MIKWMSSEEKEANQLYSQPCRNLPKKLTKVMDPRQLFEAVFSHFVLGYETKGRLGCLCVSKLPEQRMYPLFTFPVCPIQYSLLRTEYNQQSLIAINR